MMLVAASQALVLVQLGLVVGVVGGVLAYLGRRAKATDPGVLRSIRLAPQHHVHVVVIEDRRLLIGTGPSATPTLLCDLTEKPRAARETAPRSDAPRTDGPRSTPAPGPAGRPRAGWDHGG
jgi:hypothetical protein